MELDKSKCNMCNSMDISRICMDCGIRGKPYCNPCFEQYHSGSSTKNHTTIDPKNRTFILNHSVSIQSDDGVDIMAPSLYIPGHNNTDYQRNANGTVNYPDLSEFLKQNDMVSVTEYLFPLKPNDVEDDSSDNEIIKNDLDNTDKTTDKLPFLKSLMSLEEPCFLFASGAISQFESIEHFASSLKLQGQVDHISARIITFIGKYSGGEPLANVLLLQNRNLNFAEGISILKSPSCIAVFDDESKSLILNTQNMYKLNEKYVDEQLVLLNLILALSDVIVFYESNKRREDFLRIHEMMKTCKNRYGSQYSKINKRNPELLAPAIIYMHFTGPPFQNDLSTSIKDATGRNELFTSFNDVIFFDKNETVFIDGLNQILDNVSNYRTPHSFSDILQCIKNCTESLNLIRDNISSDDMPYSWFMCQTICENCKIQCGYSYGHPGGHYSSIDCFDKSDNYVYFCKKCQSKGYYNLPLVLKPMSDDESFFKGLISYPIRGKVVECKEHGIIHDNNLLFRYYEDTYILKCVHRWPGENLMSENVYPVGQILIDKVKEMSEPATEFLIKSTEYISDVVQPEDWQSTRGASNCSCCQQPFTIKMSKHHCRKCKQVICAVCYNSDNSFIICKICSANSTMVINDTEPRGVKFINIFRDYLSATSSVVKKTVSYFNRPSYWESDDIAIRCFNCGENFHYETNAIHHCRACGKCVCEKCSQEKRTVAWRQISSPSRVCDSCIKDHYWKNGP